MARWSTSLFLTGPNRCRVVRPFFNKFFRRKDLYGELFESEEEPLDRTYRIDPIAFPVSG